MRSLGATIDERIQGWEGHVEVAVFGTREPDAIAASVDDFCEQHLGSRIARYTFYWSSVASAHGVELADGRRVVVKAHQPDVDITHLTGMVGAQLHLAAEGFPCPRPLAEPAPLGHGIATVEEELDRGHGCDGHDPAFRHAMAHSLAELVDRCRSADARLLPLDRLLTLPRGRIWPTPHAAIFDFDASARGAEGIDEVASLARPLLDAVTDLGRVGHTDWRAENVRCDGDEITAAYDWESLARTSEPVLVGGVAHAFSSDWHEPPAGAQAPSPDEARAFVAEYEIARGAAFDGEDRRLLGAAYAYATAYTARCGHALDPDGEDESSEGFRTIVLDHGASLLTQFLES